MANPVVISVDDDAQVLRTMQQHLRWAFGRHYRVPAADSPGVALQTAEQLLKREEPVAPFLVGQRMVQEAGKREPVRLDPNARGEMEADVIDWLIEHGADDGYELGAALVDASVTIEDLEALGERVPAEVPAEVLPDAVAWLEAATTADECRG